MWWLSAQLLEPKIGSRCMTVVKVRPYVCHNRASINSQSPTELNPRLICHICGTASPTHGLAIDGTQYPSRRQHKMLILPNHRSSRCVKTRGDPEDGQGFPTVSLAAPSPDRVGQDDGTLDDGDRKEGGKLDTSPSRESDCRLSTKKQKLISQVLYLRRRSSELREHRSIYAIRSCGGEKEWP